MSKPEITREPRPPLDDERVDFLRRFAGPETQALADEVFAARERERLSLCTRCGFFHRYTECRTPTVARLSADDLRRHLGAVHLYEVNPEDNIGGRYREYAWLGVQGHYAAVDRELGELVGLVRQALDSVRANESPEEWVGLLMEAAALTSEDGSC